MSIIAVEIRSQQAANMAAAGDPMVDLLTQMAALQGQVANLQPGITAPTPATYTRTPELMGQSDLLDFRKKANLNVYAEGKSPIFEGDKLFDIKTETLDLSSRNYT